MRSRFRHSVRRLVIPILVVGILSVGVIRTLESGHVPGPYARICVAPQMASEDAPADLLVIGSSRTVQGVDPALVANELADTDIDTVEKVIILGHNEVIHNLALRTYLEERGAPRILGIEVGFERNANVRNSDFNFYEAMPIAPAVFTSSAYKNYYMSMMNKGLVPFSDSFIRSEVATPIEFVLNRYDVGLDWMLRNPKSALTVRHDCNREENFLNSRSNFASPLPKNPPIPPRAVRDRRAEAAAKIPKFDPTDRWIQYEISVLKDMIDTATEAGVEKVFLYIVPSYKEPLDHFVKEDLLNYTPGVGFFDARLSILDANQPLLEEQFINLHHVNRFGAYAISTDLAEFVRRLDS